MKTPAIPTVYLIAAGAVALAVAYTWATGTRNAGQQIGAGAVDLADGIIGGAVTGAGQIVGIPATNMTECERAIAEGRTWDASLMCPAGRFISDGIIGNAVNGAGQLLGIPATNMTECERAIAEGRTWDASVACPARDFLSYLWR
jgi:hypothetical protein